jgi:ATP-dependent DNA ligase
MTEWIDKLSEDDQNKAKHEEMPDWMDPMLAKLTHDYFSGEDWIFERKLDGERVLAYVGEDQNVNLMSRNQKNLNDSYPEIQEALSSQAKASCILDDESIGFGALLLGFYRNGDLIYAGNVGTGFDDETLQDLRASFDSITRQTSPFDEGHPETKNVQFVTPKLICEVAFTEWTDEDRLRHPRYKGMRRDKDIKDVHKEEKSQAAELEEA